MLGYFILLLSRIQANAVFNNIDGNNAANLNR